MNLEKPVSSNEVENGSGNQAEHYTELSVKYKVPVARL